MQCTFNYCGEKRNPAIGVANLKGRPGYPTAGCSGQYPLCAYHYQEAANGNWNSVTLVGWEAFPMPPTPEPKPTDIFRDDDAQSDTEEGK